MIAPPTKPACCSAPAATIPRWRKTSFELSTNETFVGLWKSISSTFLFVVIGIAAISLVVGGIVIMNIMLVSVTERTREIGVRKALGARYQDILLQFLIEAGAMSLIGGLIGIIAGAGVAKLVTLIIGFPSEIALWSVLVAIFVSAGIGIFLRRLPGPSGGHARSYRRSAVGT